MGCMESLHFPNRRKRLTEERNSVEVEPPDRMEQWAKLLSSRSLVIDFRDSDNRTFYEESDFVAECLRLHNLFRNRHGTPPLTLSSDLCHSAQSWANHLSHTGYFYHENVSDVGENLFCRWNYLQDFDVTGKEVVDYWYRESGHYNYDLEPDVLHVNSSAFTQLIWFSTEEVGFGKARSREGKYVVVANYSPGGNIPGLFHENVNALVLRRDSEATRSNISQDLAAEDDEEEEEEEEEEDRSSSNDWPPPSPQQPPPIPTTTTTTLQSESMKPSDSYDFESVRSHI